METNSGDERLKVSILPDGRMDTKNASRYSGYAEKTLAMKRCDGTGPRFVKPGRVYYYKDDIDAWLRARAGASTAQVSAAA